NYSRGAYSTWNGQGIYRMEGPLPFKGLYSSHQGGSKGGPSGWAQNHLGGWPSGLQVFTRGRLPT
ncbi:hypothetical protein MT418_008177, partial [Batrachochytrium dendrobatidis]